MRGRNVDPRRFVRSSMMSRHGVTTYGRIVDALRSRARLHRQSAAQARMAASSIRDVHYFSGSWMNRRSSRFLRLGDSRAATSGQSWASFCSNVALLCSNVALFCSNDASFCSNVALFCSNVALFCSNVAFFFAPVLHYFCSITAFSRSNVVLSCCV